MQRTLLYSLIQWREQASRKPILLDGARQTGKTYLLKELLGASFANVFRVDFLESPQMAEAFASSLNPQDILMNLELLTGQSITPDNTLIIFDEIGECERALQSLKYFAEQTPTYHVAASGSNIRLLQAFPVGKVEQLCLRPLSFYEFLLAADEPPLVRAFEQQLNSPAAHEKLMEKLTDYYFVGGMPEAVKTWYRHKGSSILDRIAAVQQVQQDLIDGYQRDFGKYAGQVNAQLIEAVFRSIPAQLFSVQDDSVKRFRFKDVFEKKSRYNDFSSAIDWLEKCRLLLKNFPVEGQPRIPLAAYAKENFVKLFMFDIGLLTRMLGLSYQEIKQQAFEYKGFIAENFVQQELAALGEYPTYSWQEARAEIEFLLGDGAGNIIPVEVKSGKRTRAKSLQSYIDRYAPVKSIKLTGTQGSSPLEQHNLVLPLYYTAHVMQRLNQAL